MLSENNLSEQEFSRASMTNSDRCNNLSVSIERVFSTLNDRSFHRWAMLKISDINIEDRIELKRHRIGILVSDPPLVLDPINSQNKDDHEKNVLRGSPN